MIIDYLNNPRSLDQGGILYKKYNTLKLNFKEDTTYKGWEFVKTQQNILKSTITATIATTTYLIVWES